MDEHDLIIRSLNEELHNFDQVADQTVSHKAQITDLTRQALARIKIDDLDVGDPKAVGAFAQLTSAALKAIESEESTAIKRINAKIKMQDSRRADNVSEMVTDLYEKMQLGKYTADDIPTSTIDTEEAVIDKRYLHDGVDPIEDTELRLNSDDLS